MAQGGNFLGEIVMVLRVLLVGVVGFRGANEYCGADLICVTRWCCRSNWSRLGGWHSDIIRGFTKWQGHMISDFHWLCNHHRCDTTSSIFSTALLPCWELILGCLADWLVNALAVFHHCSSGCAVIRRIRCCNCNSAESSISTGAPLFITLDVQPYKSRNNSSTFW